MRKLHILACGCVLLTACATQSGSVVNTVSQTSVFVVAHQDDWQLFMQPAAFQSMANPRDKAVFVHLTAGDAGAGTTGDPIPYFKAREEGALRAVRFMANAKPDTGLGHVMQEAKVNLAGHLIHRVSYANAVAYFLRLPDGNYEGPGYPTTNWQSLRRLREGEIGDMTAVDETAVYSGWADLTDTLTALIQFESDAGTPLTLHLSEIDEVLNPGDHSDHRHTAIAMEVVSKEFPCAVVYRHDTYSTNDKDPNVFGEDLVIDIATWAATASGLSDFYAPSTWDAVHNAWLGRSYVRITQPPLSADCPRR